MMADNLGNVQIGGTCQRCGNPVGGCSCHMKDEIAGLMAAVEAVVQTRIGMHTNDHRHMNRVRDARAVVEAEARKLLQGRDAEIVQAVALADRLTEALETMQHWWAEELVADGDAEYIAALNAGADALAAWRESRKA